MLGPFVREGEQKTTEYSTKDQVWTAGGSPVLADAGGRGPTAYGSIRNGHHQLEAWSCGPTLSTWCILWNSPVPEEDAIHEVFERKKLRYTELAAKAEQQGWRAKICPLEVGCRGFMATSTVRLLPSVALQLTWGSADKPDTRPSRKHQAW